MKKMLSVLSVISTLFAQAQNEPPKPIKVRLMPGAEEPARGDARLQVDNETYFIYDSSFYRNVLIVYQGSDYNNRRYTLLDYSSRKKNTPFTFEKIGDFLDNNDMAPVRMHSKYGVISKKGKLVIPCVYDDMLSVNFDKKTCYIIRRNNQYGIINDRNQVIVPLTYDSISKTHNYHLHLVVTKNNKQGLLNIATRKMILPINYDEIIVTHKPTLIRTRKGAEYTYFNLAGEQIR